VSLRALLSDVATEYGALTPGNLVHAATPEEHPLHNRFEWDNERAGHQYRLAQAREIIRSVRVVFPTGDPAERRSVRAFHSVASGEERVRVYEDVDEILVDPIKRALLLRDMERDWRLLRDRWRSFTEFAEMVRRDIDDSAA
jgi:hypothetical protein